MLSFGILTDSATFSSLLPIQFSLATLLILPLALSPWLIAIREGRVSRKFEQILIYREAVAYHSPGFGRQAVPWVHGPKLHVYREAVT